MQGLLGDAKFFKLEYERPITYGNDKHASDRARAVAAGKGRALREHIAPYLLRREKKEVLPDASRMYDFLGSHHLIMWSFQSLLADSKQLCLFCTRARGC